MPPREERELILVQALILRKQGKPAGIVSPPPVIQLHQWVKRTPVKRGAPVRVRGYPDRALDIWLYLLAGGSIGLSALVLWWVW